MRILRRVAAVLARVGRRFPAQVAAAALATPWALFSVSGRLSNPMFFALDLLFIVSAGAAVVSGAAQLGVRANKWPAVIGIYAGLVNFGVAEFAYLYWSVSQKQSSAFSAPLTRVDAGYFSWTTFTTTGFGDITAHSQLARLAVTAEMVLTFAAVAGGLAVLLGSRREVDLDSH